MCLVHFAGCESAGPRILGVYIKKQDKIMQQKTIDTFFSMCKFSFFKGYILYSYSILVSM